MFLSGSMQINVSRVARSIVEDFAENSAYQTTVWRWEVMHVNNITARGPDIHGNGIVRRG